MTIKILLGDNGSITRFALEQLINSQADKFQLAGSFSSCLEIIANLEQVAFDVILLGIEPENWVEQEYALQVIAMNKARVLLLQRTMDEDFYDRAILAGAKGVVDKNAPVEMILKAIEKVCDDQLWINQETTKRLIEKLAQTSHALDKADSQLMSRLTIKELEILHIVVSHASMPAKLLADKAGIKESTFRNYLTSIYGKLNLHGKSQLLEYLKKSNTDGDL